MVEVQLIQKAERALTQEAKVAQAAALDRLGSAVPGLNAVIDPTFFTPHFLISPFVPLSSPTVDPPFPPAGPLEPVPTPLPVDWRQALKDFIATWPEIFLIGSAEIDAADVTRNHLSKVSGRRFITLRQTVDGLPLIGAELRVSLRSLGQITEISSYLLPIRSEWVRERSTFISAERAFRDAAASIGVELGAPLVRAAGSSAEAVVFEPSADFPDPDAVLMANLAYLPLNRLEAVPVWLVKIPDPATVNAYTISVGALNHKIHSRLNRTSYAGEATYTTWLNPSGFSSQPASSPKPLLPGTFTPSGFQPSDGPRSSITLKALDSLGPLFPPSVLSPDGWVAEPASPGQPVGTEGNNVIAVNGAPFGGTDPLGDDLPEDQPVSADTGRNFDYEWDSFKPATDPAPGNSNENNESAIVSAFYAANWLHDRLVPLGFDESAGNFQEIYYRNGIAGDGDDAPGLGAIRIRVNVSSGLEGILLNNASYTDGTIRTSILEGPRQYTPLEPRRPVAVDSVFLFHEYFHGVVQRLLDPAGAVSRTRTRQGLEEGLCDFFAISLLMNYNDNGLGAYQFGSYSAYRYYNILLAPPLAQPFTVNYYFGLRRFPYSSDQVGVNPLTFLDIVPRSALPQNPPPDRFDPSYPPFSPWVASIQAGIDANRDEKHNMGEVFAAALLDARSLIVQNRGPAAADTLLKIVLDALKSLPPNPDYIAVRDAILVADRAINGPFESQGFRCELWTAFARRGMGGGAKVINPTQGGVGMVTESFVVPDAPLYAPCVNALPAAAWSGYE